jgi:hypothetical protein
MEAQGRQVTLLQARLVLRVDNRCAGSGLNSASHEDILPLQHCQKHQLLRQATSAVLIPGTLPAGSSRSRARPTDGGRLPCPKALWRLGGGTSTAAQPWDAASWQQQGWDQQSWHQRQQQ